VKPREDRRKVYVPARIRCDARWGDVRVLDISSNGLKLQAQVLPPRGTYIELHRNCQSIIARVVWTGQERFGVRTQDRVRIEAFLNPGSSAPEAAIDPAANDRRRQERRMEGFAASFEQSRFAGRAMEFGMLISLVACAAVLLLGMLQNTLARPLAQVSAALAAH
jgi:PilZ domain